MRRWWSKVRALLTGWKGMPEELRAEMQAHLEMEMEDNLARGMAPEEARRAFGNAALIQESAHEAWTFAAVENLGKDRTGVEKSTDGGASWSKLAAPNGLFTLALDPNAPGTIYGAYYFFLGPMGGDILSLYRSTDAGTTWQLVPQVTGVGPNDKIVVDASHQPSVIYAGASQRSDDGGRTWTPIGAPPGIQLTIAAVDPASDAVIATAWPNVGLYVSNDRGVTWQPAAGSPVAGPEGSVPGIGSVVPNPLVPGTLYASLAQSQTSAFVTKLSADGSQILFSTYLRGHPSLDPAQNTGGGIIMPAATPTGSNFAAGIALDSQGNIAIAGATRSTDFFTVNAWQNANAGQYDAFAALISADTNWLYYSTYFGGGLNEHARGLAVDGAGNLILAGQTFSGDFPVVNAAQPAKNLGDDAFVLKIAPQLPPGVKQATGSQ